jgi:hypothetical protein
VASIERRLKRLGACLAPLSFPLGSSEARTVRPSLARGTPGFHNTAARMASPGLRGRWHSKLEVARKKPKEQGWIANTSVAENTPR